MRRSMEKGRQKGKTRGRCLLRRTCHQQTYDPVRTLTAALARLQPQFGSMDQPGLMHVVDVDRTFSHSCVILDLYVTIAPQPRGSRLLMNYERVLRFECEYRPPPTSQTPP